MVQEKYKFMLREALDRYLTCLGSPAPDPLTTYLPYDFDEIGRRQWRAMAGMMVEDELRELTNILNDWQGSMLRWRAWNEALRTFPEEQAWELRTEFVEARARQCLLMPSAVRESIVFTATNAIHQVKLALGNGYHDHLDGEPKAPGKRAGILSRGQREKRLERLLEPWAAGASFMALVRRIDDATFRKSTFNYRNRFSHDIAPRLAVGFTRLVTRSVQQAEELTPQADGSFLLTPVPGKLAVSYSLGGTPPLDMAEAWAATFEQYLLARNCFQRYREVLAQAAAAVPASDASSSCQ